MGVRGMALAAAIPYESNAASTAEDMGLENFRGHTPHTRHGPRGFQPDDPRGDGSHRRGKLSGV
jgi:hypothetical protein